RARAVAGGAWWERCGRGVPGRGDGSAGREGDCAQPFEIQGGHVDVHAVQAAVGQLAVAAEVAPQSSAPCWDAAVGVKLEGRLASVERRGDVIARQLQECGALERSVAAATERLLEPGGDFGRGEVLVGGR